MQHKNPAKQILTDSQVKEVKKTVAANQVLISGLVAGPQSPKTQEAIAKFMFQHGGNFRMWHATMVKQASKSKLATSPKSPAKKR